VSTARIPQADLTGRARGLTVQHGERQDPMELAARLVADLAVAARAVIAGAGSSVFAAVAAGDELRRLATDLAAALPLSRAQQRRALAIAQQDPLGTYLDALAASTPAVSWCRRIAHPGEECWFDPAGARGDLCARVLTTAHHRSSALGPDR
jgi:hypothetical protein